MIEKRKNRLWLPQNKGIYIELCMCEKCGEAYEAGLEHICKKVNSYPMKDVKGNM